MAYFDFVPSLDFDAQEQDMLQKAAQIKALRQMDLTTKPDQPEGFTSAVTGAKFLAPKVKTPLLSALTPIIQDTTAGLQEKELTKRASDVNQAKIADAMDIFKNYPQGAPATDYSATPTNAPTNPADAVTQGGSGNYVQAAVTPAQAAQEPSQSDILGYTGRMMKNPLTRALAMENAKEQIITIPKELRAAKTAALLKQAEFKNARDVAYIRANAGSGKFTPNFGENGEVVGSHNDKTNVYTYADGSKLDLNTGIKTSATGQQEQAVEPTAGAASAPVTGGTAAPTQTSLPRSSGQVVPVPGMGNVPAEKIPGYTPTFSNKSSETIKKANQEAITGYGNAHTALSVIGEMKQMLAEGNVETSGMAEMLSDSNAWLGNIAPSIGLNGQTNPAVDRFKAFITKASQINSLADRKMFGPGFTNDDVKQIQASMGSLQRATSNEARITILNELEKQFGRKLGLEVTVTAPDGSTNTGTSSAPRPAVSPVEAKPAVPVQSQAEWRSVACRDALHETRRSSRQGSHQTGG